MPVRTALHFLIVLGFLPCAVSALGSEPVDFSRDVQPILARHCTMCHGIEKQESDLRLDNGASLLKGGNAGLAIVPGKSSESLLIQAITGQSADYKMPPEGDGPTAEEIAVLTAWIDQGAIVPDDSVAQDDPRRRHWSFQPVTRPALPEVSNPAWIRNPIDAFVLARLDQQGIAPSPEADRVTQIRRLCLDLLGLPPTLAQIDEYLSDTRPDAYEQLVDRLLDSPHHGERWGRHWLDQARYADSNGFTIDGPRSIWKYRDWVIGAINRDLPFDQFTIEQLAGDMLPDATTEQIVATGFHRNTLINQEGGTDPEQFRVESVVDRVNTTGAVFLGLTVGCAQCHTHKYDPISQREYYQLFAFYNGADEPTIVAPSVEQSRQLSALRAEIVAAQAALEGHDAAQADRQAEWERQYAARNDALWTLLDLSEFRSVGGALLTELADGSVLVGGTIPATDTYIVTADAPPGPITAVRLETLTHNTISNNGPGLTENGNFSLTEFSFTAAALDSAGQPGEAQPVPIARAVADNAQADRPVTNAFDGNQMSAWSFGFQAGVANTDHRAVFIPQNATGGEHGTRLTFTLDHQIDLRPGIGRFQLLVTSAPPAALELGEAIRAIVGIPVEKRTPAQHEQLAAAFRAEDAARAPLAAHLADLKARERRIVGDITTTMVMQELPKPRETFINIRGDFLRKGAQVQANVPAVLPPLAEGQPANRLGLARWLVDPRNPLTPRVTMNRFWQQYFGVGLVETENDFGTQGSPPTHPELLDWLANEFVAQGWSMKAMHRLIVNSATYRQSSHARPDLATVDPRNKLLARQARLRLEAESIRDVALAASGLLSAKIGGPGVFPPQPAGIYAFTQQDKQWKASPGEDRFRRGLYTYFWRSSPYPFLMTFDAPPGNTTCTRRVRSNTPLQALTLANDDAFVEIAAGLAARVMREAPTEPTLRARYAFRLCLGREPNEVETRRLVEFLRAQTERFQADAAAAQAVAPADRPADLPAHEAAACAALSRVLLNLDEFVTRE
jgi:hypothetical protein